MSETPISTSTSTTVDLTDAAMARGDGRTVADDRSLTEVLSSLTTDISELLRTQLELAKVELKEEAATAGRAAAMGAGAAVVGLCTLLLLGMTVAWALAEALDPWAGFLIVTVLYGAIAAGLGLAAKSRIAAMQVPPPKTTETLQEDAEWLRQHRS